MKKIAIFSTIIFMMISTYSAAAAQSIDQIAEQYVKLVLAMGQHDGGYVDAYYGPEAWAEQAKGKNIPVAQIVSDAEILRGELPKASEHTPLMQRLRLYYLDQQLVALIGFGKNLSGDEKLDFDAQSRELYDTEAPHNKLTDFDPLVAEVEAMLPGEGPIAERIAAFKKQFEIPADKLQAVFDRAIQECRDRTKQHIKLLPNENFTLEYVTDKPWSGYNWYKGDAYSLIQVNTEYPIDISRAVDLGCHEGYPGHHTYNALLEQNLVKERNWVEYSVYPLFSPQSLIAEGSANYGIQLAFPGKQKAEFEKNVLFPIAGIDPALNARFERFGELTAKLGYASNEVARMYINGEIDKTKAVSLLQKYSFATKEKATQRVRFFDTYGAYVINYNWGRDLIKQYVETTDDQNERWARFTQLLSSPRLPSSLDW
ncbi:hypothetical protein [Neptunicella marina]|uniref:DUF885 domain-containing protein n=1 Tax=Neptunicella marina TaxID=2125989 RepID=A0A8J6IWV2_9ALTE|nr:hypothetical protein [Neptunicella marina]MBC3767052.1 hypothetical protein [Neptunicella marina]